MAGVCWSAAVVVVVVVVRPKVLPSDQRQSNYPGNWQQEATGRAAVTFTKMTNTHSNRHSRLLS